MLGMLRCRAAHFARLGRVSASGILVLCAIAACTGPAPQESVLGEAFRANAAAVCVHARALKDAQPPFPYPDFNPTKPDVAQFPEVAAALKLTDVTWRTWEGEMVALGEPATGSDVWADVVAAVRRHRELNAEQIVAATNGDAATFSKDYDEGVATQAAMLKAATAAGLPECAKVDR